MTKKRNKIQLAAIVLAAGASRRLGTPKQFIPFKGESLLRHALKQVMKAGLNEILLVTGFQSGEITKETSDLSINTFYNNDWERGQGASLSAGLKQILEKNPGLNAVLITPCDQPFLNAEHIVQLIETYQPDEQMIVASGYSNTFGVPILVDRNYFDELLQLKGDEGGKKVLKPYESAMQIVPFPKGAIDIDEAEDLRHL